MASENYRDQCVALIRSVLRAVFVPRSREIIWRFLESVVVVPLISGSRAGGPLDTGRMPQWRGLLERYDDAHVHYVTIAKAARIGGTLFFGVCVVINKILRRPGPIGWLDPTRGTAKSLSRREIEPYLHACPGVMQLAIVSKTTWTTLEKMFVNCVFTMLGSGSINDLGGRQFEEAIINEQDRIRGWKQGEPTPSNEMEARTSQFARTRKIIRNCTPFSEGGLTWTEFVAGSQEHSYQPCPECHGYQRLTFTREPAEPDRWMRIADNDPMLAQANTWLPINHPEDPRNAGAVRPADSRRPGAKHIKRDPAGRGWLVKGTLGDRQSLCVCSLRVRILSCVMERRRARQHASQLPTPLA
jgi:phage terminase large subunit GpA-like protein